MSLELVTPASAAVTDAASGLALLRAKRAYTTRRVPLGPRTCLLQGEQLLPCAGDLVLARVTRVGKHKTLELTDSRRSTLFVGDEIVVAYGARYAPDQFDARLPDTLGPCHLAAGGGVAALVTQRHAGVSAPTELQPLGLLADAQGRRLNLVDGALPRRAPNGPRPLSIASLGTSMNAGKTTAAAHLVRGLVRAGLRVGAAKVTGTGSGNDPGLLRDAGAELVLDFTDLGHASTAGLDLPALLEVLNGVQGAMAEQGVDVLVLEVADGLLQRETAMLLRSPHFAKRVDASLFSSGDAMGAVAGVHWLREQGLPVLALAGAMTASPLALAEAQAGTGLTALRLQDLSHAEQALSLVAQARALATGGAAA
jgi:hypothetical protein